MVPFPATMCVDPGEGRCESLMDFHLGLRHPSSLTPLED